MLLSIANLYRLHFVGTNTIQISIIINYLLKVEQGGLLPQLQAERASIVAEVACFMQKKVRCGTLAQPAQKKWSKN